MWIHGSSSHSECNNPKDFAGSRRKTRRKKKMKITILFYLTLVSLVITTGCQGFNPARWMDSIYSQSFDDNCITGNCNNYYPQKRSRGFGEMEQFNPESSAYHLASGQSPWYCSCETQYGILDLGPQNYPRYLANAQCQPNSCHNKFNPCKLIHYKVHVLRERELEDGNDTGDEQYVEQSFLPESLRVKWQFKPVKIAVACVAATEGRKN